MPISTKVSGAFKNVSEVSVKVSGSWKSVAQAYVKVSGVWKELLLPAIAYAAYAITPRFNDATKTLSIVDPETDTIIDSAGIPYLQTNENDIGGGGITSYFSSIDGVTLDECIFFVQKIDGKNDTLGFQFTLKNSNGTIIENDFDELTGVNTGFGFFSKQIIYDKATRKGLTASFANNADTSANYNGKFDGTVATIEATSLNLLPMRFFPSDSSKFINLQADPSTWKISEHSFSTLEKNAEFTGDALPNSLFGAIYDDVAGNLIILSLESIIGNDPELYKWTEYTVNWGARTLTKGRESSIITVNNGDGFSTLSAEIARSKNYYMAQVDFGVDDEKIVTVNVNDFTDVSLLSVGVAFPTFANSISDIFIERDNPGNGFPAVYEYVQFPSTILTTPTIDGEMNSSNAGPQFFNLLNKWPL